MKSLPQSALRRRPVQYLVEPPSQMATYQTQPVRQELPRKFLFTIDDAAGLLSISRRSLYHELSSGHLDSVYIGSRRLIPHAVLATYVNRLMREQGLGQYITDSE